MAKIKINKLPKGFSIRDGQVVEDRTMQDGGGLTTGDQADYGLVTTPQAYYGSTNFNNSQDENVRYSLSSVPREDANIEAEGGETVLTDLNDDGTFGLYGIKGPRHGSGGVPMFLPDQSFIFSDTRKLKLTKDEMSEFDAGGSKKTPAKISKKFGLQEYYGELDSQYADKISATSAELMLKKNMNDLSKLAFMQEAKKDFEDGVPLASHPYLVSIGEDPIEFTARVEEISRQEAEAKALEALPLEQQQQIMMMQQMMAQQEQQQMPPQGMPPQGMQDPMGAFMPEPGEPGLAMENNAMMNPMAQFGSELGDFLVQAGQGKELRNYQDAGETTGKVDNTMYEVQGQPVDRNTYLNYVVKHNMHKSFDGVIDQKFLDDLTEDEKISFSKTVEEGEDIFTNTTGSTSIATEAVTTNETIDVTAKQTESVKDGKGNPYADGSDNAKQYDQYIADGYIPTIVKDGKKNRISFVRPAKDGRTIADPTEVQVFDQDTIIGSGNLDPTYSGDVRTQQELNNDETIGDIATFIPGRFSGNNLPNTQFGADEFGYGSSQYSTQESEEDFFYRNKSITDELPGFKFNMKKSDPGYDKNWRDFQNKYEEKRKDYFNKKGVQYIPYFFTDEVLAERLKTDPKTYDKDGDGKVDKEWTKRKVDGKRGGFTVNAPGFDMDYSPEDKQSMDLPDDPQADKKIPPINPKDQPRKEWWKQDLNNIASLNAIDDELFLPFAPVLEDQKIDYVLDDYTGRVNANLGAQNTMAGAYGAYGQQAIARNNLQGNTVKANAAAQNQVNQNNVRTMNQIATMQPQLDMKVDQANNATTQKLYDSTITSLQNSQNFKNWKTGRYNDLYNAGLTNASNTYNMNQLYDYYNINPTVGGDVEFGPDGRRLMKESQNDGSQKRIEQWQQMQEYMGKDENGVQNKVDKDMMEWIYGNGPKSNNRSKGQNEMINNQGMLPPGYDADGNRMTTKTARKGTETKKLPKWAVPFYSGKMGM